MIITRTISLFNNYKLRVFLSRILGAVTVLVLQLTVLKLENANVSGMFFIAYTLFQITNVLSRFGADIFLVRNYHNYNFTKRHNEFNDSFFCSFFMSVPLSILFLVLGWLYALSWFGNDISTEILLIISIGLTLPLTSSASIIFYIFQAKKKVITQTLGLNVLQPLAFLILYLVMKFGTMTLDVDIGVFPLVVSFYLSALFIFMISMRFSKIIAYPIIINRKYLSMKLHMARLKKNNQFIFSAFGTQLLGWMPYLISSFVLGPVFASVFNLIQRFAMITSFISIAINSVSTPQMAGMLKYGKWDEIQKVVKTNTMILSVFSSGYVFCCLLFLVYFTYLDNSMLLPAIIVMLGYAINCSTSACGYYFQVIADVKKMNVVIYGVILSVPFSAFILSNIFESVGAAISIFSAVTLVNAILFPMMVVHMRHGFKSMNSD
ncbi:Polysaccharide biosynthesis protein [Serratia fonticola]|nr:Polysaccharide biosynthesis protein [Serratia fonticola]